MLNRSRKAAALALVLSCSVGCWGSGWAFRKAGNASRANLDTIMYRLALRHNAVDSGAAFRCFGGCQAERNPKAYVDCLAECPGFEIAEGETCTKKDVPPVAACFTARPVERESKPTPGQVVVATVGAVLFVVSLNALCASARSYTTTGGSCNLGWQPPPQ